jgi:bacterioferritin-associated ferredoxin
MYVCICHAITEKDIQQAVDKGASSIARLSELTMLGTQCGHCTQHAHQVLNQCANKPV